MYRHLGSAPFGAFALCSAGWLAIAAIEVGSPVHLGVSVPSGVAPTCLQNAMSAAIKFIKPAWTLATLVTKRNKYVLADLEV